MRGAPEGRDLLRCLHLYPTGVVRGWGYEKVGAIARVLEQLNCKNRDYRVKRK